MEKRTIVIKHHLAWKILKNNIDSIYKLDINYRNSKAVYNYGKRILDDNTTSGSIEKGMAMLIRIETEEQLKEHLEEYRHDKDAVIVSRHSKIRTRLYKRVLI